MRIDDVKDHIGEEWRVGPWRMRIEGVEGVEEYGRSVRHVRCTRLDPATGAPLPDARFVRANMLMEPWAAHEAKVAEAEAYKAAVEAAVDRIDALLPPEVGGAHASSSAVWPIALTIDQANAIADLADWAGVELAAAKLLMGGTS
jgi:hypothetical protein